MLTGVYVTYLIVSAILTHWVARTLFHSGRPFLIQVFHNDAVRADAVNQLLVVGFYLVNAGLIGITMYEGGVVDSLQAAVELISTKIGRTLFVLGVMHFVNLVVFCHIRDRKTSVQH